MEILLKLFAYGCEGIAVFMFFVWLLSVKFRDASLVDRFWGLNFILIGIIYALHSPFLYWRSFLVLGLVTVWGLRLSYHIHKRNKGHGEDHRYKAMREKHPQSFWILSLFTVFLTQGLLACLISAPLLWILGSEPVSFSILDLLAVLVWILGFYFEVEGDRELQAFQKDSTNKGKVLNTGLWSLTRHPNYFGEASMWWSYFLLACNLPLGFLSFVGPMLMTLFLRFVSGVTLLEKTLKRTKSGFAEYMSKTPAFVPRLSGVWTLLFKKRPG